MFLYDQSHCFKYVIRVSFVLKLIIVFKMETKNLSELFCDLVKDAAIQQEKKYSKNDILFKEGEHAEGIFYISQGKVKIVKHKIAEVPVILHIAKEGELLGVQAVIDNASHLNDAIAMDDVETNYVPAKDFIDAINKNTEMKLLIMQAMCSRIDRIENQISSRSEKSANQRFAEVLSFLVKDYGLSKDKKLNIDLSLEELASLSGTSKNYLSKIINDFSHHGWIKSDQGHFKILDLNQLEEIAKT